MTSTARELLQQTMTEDVVLGAIVEHAQARGWLVAHFRPALTGRGYRTAMQGDVGFVDLVLARDGVVFCWEVKGWQHRKGRRPELGRPTLAQQAWVEQLRGGVTDARVVYPDDLDRALRALELGRWPTS